MKLIQKGFIGAERKAILKYVWSHLLIFLIPISCFFVFFHIITDQFLKNERKNIEKILNNNVQTIQTTMDEYIKRCQAINYVLLQNEKMHYLLNFANDNQGENTANIYFISTELKSLCLTNDFISDILICINQNGINISQQGRISTEDVYNQYIEEGNGGFTYQEWLNESISFSGGRLISLKNGAFYFMRTYPVTPRGRISDSTTLIKIKDDNIKNILKGIDNIDGAVVEIIDDKTGDNILTLSQDKYFDLVELPYEYGGCLIQDGYLISYQRSEQLSISYLSAIPLSYFLSQKYNMLKLTIGAFLFCLIIGCGLIIYYTLKKSNPVRQLMSLVEANGSGTSNFLDPYFEIKSILLDAADQKLAYMNQNKYNDFNEKKRTFIAILYNKKGTEEFIRQNAEQVGILHENNQSCFIKFKCIDISTYFEKINDYGKIDCTPIQFCTTIISEILSKHYNLTSIPYGQEAFLILTLEDNKMEFFYKNINSDLQQVSRLIQENYGIDILIAISYFHSGIKGLKSGFKEVNKILEYMEFTGNKNYCMAPVFKNSSEFYTASVKEEAILLNYIKSGDFNKAKVLFNNIIKVYFSEVQGSPQISKFRLYALVSKILETLNCINILDAGYLIEELNEYSPLMNFDNMPEFQQHINGLFDKLEVLCRNTEEQEKAYFIKNINEIILHNYMNPDLNVSMIANLLNKNLDYISRTFKKITGNGLLEYIQEFRINKAKSYLDENSDLSIRQVSSMVGYINCESFIRVFKHKEGVTPGRYKTMIRKK